jgi:4-phytase/acid phosphatase
MERFFRPLARLAARFIRATKVANRAVKRGAHPVGRAAVFTALLAFLLTPVPSPGQSLSHAAKDDNTVLKQIIIFGRHSVRSAAAPSNVISVFASQPYPDFGVPTGYLTPHGAQASVLLGRYFRDYLRAEGLLSGKDAEDAEWSYFRANSIQRSNITAASLASGLLPGASVPIHSFPLGTPDPIFDPIAAGVVTADGARAVKEVAGIYGTEGSALSAAYRSEDSLMRSALFSYPRDQQPPPATPSGLTDATAQPISLTASTGKVATTNVINVGGLRDRLLATDPFVMEYTDNLPIQEVAWGRLSLEEISQLTRIITLYFAIDTNPPYLNQLQSSNAMAHILRSMEQEVYGHKVPGAFTGKRAHLLVINSSDGYVEGVASLLHMHWLLPGYQPDFCAPGGSLVFELRRSKRSGRYIVRAYYTAQTFDQLRTLTPLTVERPPATQQLLIPHGRDDARTLDVDFGRFQEIVHEAIDKKYVQNPTTEVAPGPLAGVPLR